MNHTQTIQFDEPESPPSTSERPASIGGAVAGAELRYRTATGFRLLGPLSLTNGRDVVVLQPSKPTTLLAAMLLHANAVVSTGYLLRAVWGEDQPATTKAALHTCITRLRRTFAKHSVHTEIETLPGGYRIVADAETLDLIKFRQLLGMAAAESGPDGELEILRYALSLWDGPLLGNVTSAVLLDYEVPYIAEERLRATERVFAIQLGVGRCREVLPELWAAARSHPGHEPFSEQLIEALYRTGRQTEALSEYHRVKSFLHEELAVSPGPRLQRLELDILCGNDLGSVVPGQPPTSRFSAAAPRQSGRLAHRIHSGAERSGGQIAFVGRQVQLASLGTLLAEDASGLVTVVLSGPPGIGKTALAVQVAQLSAEHFPGGGFVVPMSRPDGSAREPDQIVADLLGAVPPDRRAVVVLDDARSANQTRPVLAHVTGAAIVTSRMSLGGLIATHGGSVHRLGCFEEGDATALLQAILGPERVAAEPAAVRSLCAACGHYPLALRIIGTRLLTRPRLRIADCLDWLRGGDLARWSLADTPELSVPKVFGDALLRLGPDGAEAFVKIGGGASHPISLMDAATMLGRTPAAAEQVLELLADASLLEEGPPGRYQMPDLLRMFARQSDASVPALAVNASLQTED